MPVLMLTLFPWCIWKAKARLELVIHEGRLAYGLPGLHLTWWLSWGHWAAMHWPVTCLRGCGSPDSDSGSAWHNGSIYWTLYWVLDKTNDQAGVTVTWTCYVILPCLECPEDMTPGSNDGRSIAQARLKCNKERNAEEDGLNFLNSYAER